jgi:acetyl esterase
MGMNPVEHAIFKGLSDVRIDLRKHYHLDRIFTKIMHPSIKLRYKIWDRKVFTNGHSIPVRIFSPLKEKKDNLIVFFHGGGWVSGDIESYTSVCAELANNTGCFVMSVDYRLAPEHPFPAGLNDCYDVAEEFIRYNSYLGKESYHIILMGDSAGGNLAAAVSLLAADRKDFKVERQILLYPSLYNDHTVNSPYASIRENGTDYLLTSQKIQDYQDLYIKDKEDLNSPYFAPLLSDHLEGQPKTLIITAEYDPLRDEGEAYGHKLQQFGNDVEMHRIKDVLHGFFSFSSRLSQVRSCYAIINDFLGEPI